jgi:4-diphosphocytidyl-2-C-methyl-D-erythritol kinase
MAAAHSPPPPDDDTRPTLRRLAHAKVNLALAVGGPVSPEDDAEHAGLHPIASWMAPIDLADELHLTRLEEDRLSRYAIIWHGDAPQPAAAINWSITADLAVRAHRLLERETGRSLPLQLRLEKKIPVGAGLGGGSSDAAAMLRAVRDLFELAISDAQLREFSCELGSDVAFFLNDRHAGAGGGNGWETGNGGGEAGAANDPPAPALVERFGDALSSAPMVPGHLVLLLPEFTCSTARVYHAFDERLDDDDEVELRTADVQHAVSRCADDGRLLHELLFNDLASPAERIEPRLARVRSEVERAIGSTPHVTGSGSAMFIACPSTGSAGGVEADLLAQQLDALLDGVRAIPARLL